jgi:hypothetical protein
MLWRLHGILLSLPGNLTGAVSRREGFRSYLQPHLFHVFQLFRVVLVHAVRPESNQSGILFRLLEWSSAIWARGSCIARFHPNVRDVDELSHRSVLRFLPLAEVHARAVKFRPGDTVDDPDALATVIQPNESHSRCRTRFN